MPIVTQSETLPVVDDNFPIGLRVLVRIFEVNLGWTPSTFRQYIHSKDIRERWLLDMLFIRVSGKLISSRKRIRLWAEALDAKYSQPGVPIEPGDVKEGDNE